MEPSTLCIYIYIWEKLETNINLEFAKGSISDVFKVSHNFNNPNDALPLHYAQQYVAICASAYSVLPGYWI